MISGLKRGLFAGRWSGLLIGAAIALSCSKLNVDVPPDAVAGAGQGSGAVDARVDAPSGPGSATSADGPLGSSGALNDPSNCGRSAHDCTRLANVRAGAPVQCQGGQCVVPTTSCVEGYGHCSPNPDDGCETNLTRAETCGACGVACSGAAALCANVSGRFQCTNSCGAVTPDMCGTNCTNLQTDAENCGRCGNSCNFPNAQAKCVAGSCAVASCIPGFADCNSDLADGCEASLSRAETCGSCTVSCTGTTMLCANMGGRLQCGNSCAEATPDNCGTRCANLQTDAQNCGTCGHVCSLPNAQARCVAGSCAVASCNAGFDDCNSSAADGCEASLSRPQTCGSCTVSCTGTNALCANMSGRFQCANSCAGATPDNCGARCANLQTDPQNCGTCGRVCSLPNAQAACLAGGCIVRSCNAGFGNCNNVDSDGCEVNVRGNDNNHCGSCNACMQDQACQAGVCVTVCGTAAKPCCENVRCNTGLLCVGLTCTPCGTLSQPCCQHNTCQSGFVCSNASGNIFDNTDPQVPDAYCHVCGAPPNICCPGFACSSPFKCIESAGFYCLNSCGAPGESCCVLSPTGQQYCTFPATCDQVPFAPSCH
jgi:hypothetical protein